MIADSYLNGNTALNAPHAARTPVQHAGFFLPYLKPGMRVLDCGCGSGDTTLLLAEQIGEGEIIGIDPDAALVEAARKLAAEREATSVQFRTARFSDLPFSDGIFDAVFANSVLERLADPLRALTEMGRVLRPGGFLGIRSPDWGGCLVAPSTPDVDLILEQYHRLQFEQGGNPYVGRQLRALLRAVGFTNIRASASYECFEDIAPIAEHLMRQLEANVSPCDPDGDCDPDAADDNPGTPRSRYEEVLRAWSQHPDAFFARAWCEAVGKKASCTPKGGVVEAVLPRSDF